MMTSEVFLLIILWEDESKVLLGPNDLFELDDEIEGSLLEIVFKAGKDAAGRLTSHGMSSLRWVVNLE